MTKSRKCKQCKTNIDDKPKSQVFCSRSCFATYRWSKKERTSFCVRAPSIKKICLYCKRSFKLSSSNLRRGKSKGKYCSMHCCLLDRPITAPERVIIRLLNELGLTFEREHPIKQKKTRRTVLRFVDFYIPAYNLIIEVYGDYWHNMPKRKKGDALKEKYLLSKGYDLLVFWESDIHENERKVLSIIMDRMQSCTNMVPMKGT